VRQKTHQTLSSLTFRLPTPTGRPWASTVAMYLGRCGADGVVLRSRSLGPTAVLLGAHSLFLTALLSSSAMIRRGHSAPDPPGDTSTSHRQEQSTHAAFLALCARAGPPPLPTLFALLRFCADVLACQLSRPDCSILAQHEAGGRRVNDHCFLLAHGPGLVLSSRGLGWWSRLSSDVPWLADRLAGCRAGVSQGLCEH